ncbi:MAG: ribosomal protein S18-alanine N-acetyltransferase [Ilumatobacteraceae bacterium]|nr:ribosomal protein S18-alanine N-acetyltransferase [Ilumatobacteraceae bacterium]
MSVLDRLLPSSADGPVVVEPMRRRHLSAMMPIERAAYPKPWSRGVFESELQQVRDGSRLYLVARRGRAVLGYAGVWIVPDPDGAHAHLTNVAVDPAHRRSGVATRLLVELAQRIIERGCVGWTLEVRMGSTGAQELYRRFGFVPAGVRKGYYEQGEDALVMWCHDIHTPEYAARLEALCAS